MISVIDNFLEKEVFEKIQNILFSSHFPWYYNQGVVNKDEGELHSFQFTHVFFRPNIGCTSSYYDILKPCAEQLNIQDLIKCKANLLTKTETNVEHGFHVDLNHSDNYHKTKTSILYINTNNGYTKFENGNVVKSIENRMVSFDSNLKHTGSSCTDKNTRIVINFNYFLVQIIIVNL